MDRVARPPASLAPGPSGAGGWTDVVYAPTNTEFMGSDEAQTSNSPVRRPRRRGRSGGAATTTGIDFQARFAAYVACGILAGSEATPLWDWPATETLESIHVETEEVADDVLVGMSSGARGFVQAKSRVQLSTAATSPLGEAVEQLVRQFVSRSADAHSEDRLVLTVGPTSSAAVRQRLPLILQRVRGLRCGTEVTAAALNQEEERELNKLLGHVRRAWSDMGPAPSNADLRRFLGLLRISVFDPADGGDDVREAKGLLRRSILSNPTQEGAAFDLLVAAAVGFGAAQTGADRPALQQLLRRRGIDVRAAPSYRRDIARLMDHSRQAVTQLARYATIAGAGGTPVSIDRTAPGVLAAAAEQQSLLVTGDPGTGKSATLHHFAEQAMDAGRDVVVLSSDSLKAASVGDLRTELNLEHDLIDVLQNWPGSQPAFLVIDALDAARGEHAQQTFLDLIGYTDVGAERWRIVAAIRRFDLRYNKSLQALFSTDEPAAGPEFQESEFAAARHFKVPTLRDDELAQLASLAPDAHAVVRSATVELGALLRVPFNLRLLSELVSSGVARAELSAVTTQLQLLERYWQHRVIDGSGGDPREVVLRRACEEMIDRRALQIQRAAILTEIGAAQPLAQLLSRHVLAEADSPAGGTERELIAFAHHVLFDYALARLLFRGAQDSLVQRVRETPELLLVVRPSFETHFRFLWEQQSDSHAFWELAVSFAEADGMPAIGVIIGPSVAAQLVAAVQEVAPLLDVVLGAASTRRDAADLVLSHLIGARLAAGEFGTSIPADRRHVWAEIGGALTPNVRGPTVYAIRNLVMELCETPCALDAATRTAVGVAARSLLGWSIAQPTIVPAIARVAIAGVARTFGADAAGSELLLRQIIEPDRLAAFGYVELPDLADEAARLVPVAPQLVRDIYMAAFAFEETSTAKTVMREGILAMSSHRRQDYEMAHYVLAKDFPSFLRNAPAEALAALSEIRLQYAVRRQRVAAVKESPLRIAWLADVVEIQSDGSYGGLDLTSHEEESMMLAHFSDWLGEIANANSRELRSAVAMIRSDRRPASIWRQVLSVAATLPSPFTRLIEPLVTAPAVLRSPELGPVVAHFLQNGFALFSNAARRRLERAIMGLPDSYVDIDDGSRARERGEQDRDRFLGLLPADSLISRAAQRRHAELQSDGELSTFGHEPVMRWESRPRNARNELASEGVDVDAPANLRIQQLEAPVEEFVATNRNQRPSTAAAKRIAAPLLSLVTALRADDGADERQLGAAWGTAAEAAETVARVEDLTEIAVVAVLARDVLLEAARHPRPSPRDDDPTRFDEQQSWGGDSPRINAARGLMLLARNAELADDEILGTLELLGTDPVPVVRYFVAQCLDCLRLTAPGLMWGIAEVMLRGDDSMSVLQALVTRLPFMTLPDDRVDRLARMLRDAFARASGETAGAAKVRELCIGSMTSLYVMRGTGDAQQFLQSEVLPKLKDDAELAQPIPYLLRDALTYATPNPPGKGGEVRRRAISLATDLFEQAAVAMSEWNTELAGQSIGPDDPALAGPQTIAHVLDSIAAEVYFATGAFEEQRGQTPTVSVAQRERFYNEASALLDALCGVTFPRSTHHVVQALESFVPFDPRGVFLRVVCAVTSGQAGGYQTDSMAAGLVVQIIERYLAEYRTLLQQDDDCRAGLIAVLDIFVAVGWPAALRLTYGLQEIYR